MLTKLALLATAAAIAAVPVVTHAQTAGLLNNQPPDGAVFGYLMTDGSVIYQGFNLTDMWKLTPDQTGSYLNGTWTQIASLPYGPDAPSGAVLGDGRLLIEGGEYLLVGNKLPFTLTNKGAIYDPNANTWTDVKAPGYFPYIGDSPDTVLPNGLYLLGDKLNTLAATLDPKTLTWTRVPTTGKNDHNAEEGWTLMPDGTIVTVDVKKAPNSEQFFPQAGQWQSLGNTPVLLASPREEGAVHFGPHHDRSYLPAGETGPEILRPDGTIFAAGSIKSGSDNIAHSAIFHPAHGNVAATWTAGPDFQPGDDPGDSYAVLEPNGRVLITTSTLSGEQREEIAHDFLERHVAGASAAQAATAPPTYRLYEFDGTNLTLLPETIGSYVTPHLLVLPTGEVIVGGFALLGADGTPAPAWAPVVKQAPDAIKAGLTYKISGLRFNGPSQAAQFGDEFTTAENYPVVRVTNRVTGHVVYCRTHDHSTMGVATGNMPVYTYFDVPGGIEPGTSKIQVVADGIASNEVSVDVK